MRTAANFIDDSRTYKPAAIAALKAFKARKTFKPEVTEQQRENAMFELVNGLAEVYQVPAVLTIMREEPEGTLSMTDGRPIIPIVLKGSLSIITLLTKFAVIRNALNGTTLDEMAWAVNLFRKVYPRQFEKLVFDPERIAFVKPAPVVEVAQAIQSIEEMEEAA